MKKEDLKDVKQLLSAPKKIVIVPHKNPDGDAMGSSLGLMHYLKKLNHNVTVIAPNDYPQFLKWIPGDPSVIIYEKTKKNADTLINDSDLIFTLDFNALHRTGDMETSLENSDSIKIMIDHHQQPEDYAKYVYSDVEMCSTSQMIYHFIDMLGDTSKIDADISTCLYTGIMTDTGSFRFRATTSETHRVIAELIDKGADNAQIHNNVYDTNSYGRLQLLGCAMNNLKILPDLKTSYMTLSQKELNSFDFKKGDTEGFVNYGLSVNGIVFTVIFIEHQKEGIVKISLRSKGDFDVNEFAREHFNGGGHTNAAGGRSTMSLTETVEKFITILPSYKKDLIS
ncbi:MAG: bifunctional oligoribonuclease/PAP phosphatase NrnA [Bacteroidia bacterium]|nr:bifunctional oligoribonuclease/PAP phosphatase NrnA [Bacteroidia bacterium]NNK28824.1 bifunctional oligoribonuclease/PAP phosphatase NrnA [Flavobacteriaceae bacterium]